MADDGVGRWSREVVFLKSRFTLRLEAEGPDSVGPFLVTRFNTLKTARGSGAPQRVAGAYIQQNMGEEASKRPRHPLHHGKGFLVCNGQKIIMLKGEPK